MWPERRRKKSVKELAQFPTSFAERRLFECEPRKGRRLVGPKLQSGKMRRLRRRSRQGARVPQRPRVARRSKRRRSPRGDRTIRASAADQSKWTDYDHSLRPAGACRRDREECLQLLSSLGLTTKAPKTHAGVEAGSGGQKLGQFRPTDTVGPSAFLPLGADEARPNVDRFAGLLVQQI